MNSPITYLITDGRATDETLEASMVRLEKLFDAALKNGVTHFQIREKQLSGEGLFSLTQRLTVRKSGAEMKLLVNDRADIAAAAGADGVHLTSNSLGADVVRRRFGSLLVFVSTHNESSVARAEDKGADAVVFGPVFSTPGKGPALGVEVLHAVCILHRNLPIMALGGVNAETGPEALRHGASGIAGIRAFGSAKKIAETMNALRNGK